MIQNRSVFCILKSQMEEVEILGEDRGDGITQIILKLSAEACNNLTWGEMAGIILTPDQKEKLLKLLQTENVIDLSIETDSIFRTSGETHRGWFSNTPFGVMETYEEYKTKQKMQESICKLE